jgi:hypothetical protein
LEQSLNRDKFPVWSNFFHNLFHNFDPAFYIICNPDVASFIEGPFAHWKKYGKKEKRVSSPDKCYVENSLITSIALISATNYFNKLDHPKITKILGSKIYQIPWRPGIAGFPSRIVSVELKLKTYIFNRYVIPNEGKFILRRRFLNKYEILFDCDQI